MAVDKARKLERPKVVFQCRMVRTFIDGGKAIVRVDPLVYSFKYTNESSVCEKVPTVTTISSVQLLCR